MRLDPSKRIISVDEQKAIREQTARILETQERAAEIAAMYPPSEAQLEALALQAQMNAFAERFPLYAAARSVAVHHLVLPLAPGTTEPVVDPHDASNDARTLFEWWRATPDANVGAMVGRASNLIALHIADNDAVDALRELAAIEWPADLDRKSGREYREISGGLVAFRRPYAAPKSQAVWGKQGLIEQTRGLAAAVQATSTGESYIAWSYPPVQSGTDAFDFHARRVGRGLDVLGDGDVVPWAGRLTDGRYLSAPQGALPVIPTWLAATLGKPRSRKAMRAQREQYEADLRMANAHLIAEVAAQRAAEEEVRAQAAEARARADAMLAEAMKDGK